MNGKMRAKMEVRAVVPQGTALETIEMAAVSATPFGPDGVSQDNTYARWTPSGTLYLTITNPDLVGQFKVGQKFYLDFTEAIS